MNVNIKIIPHGQQRYDTVGDYETMANGDVQILVSEMGDEKMEFLIGLHEIIEQELCKIRGISEDAITKFDIEYEKNRKEGDTSEPGDDLGSPYRKEHFIATNVERLMAAQLGIDWQQYEGKINSL